MTRRLDADEQALWNRVIATVTPLEPQKAAAEVEPTPLPATRPPLRKEAGPRRLKPQAVPPKPAPTTPTESLDASWDRRLASGRLEPEMTIDLHGLSRDMARHLLYRRVHDAEARGIRTILVITGKGHMPGPSPADLMEGRPARGAIRADFPRWLGEDALSGRIAAVRRAHPKHGGAGAAYLILKRKRG
ncbi:Smr/MutS family protein [Sandaracinobacteroides hominis]|uniref:Smr/MutS family protein n=1 Tax=Sandaracinobacteroides hominis TaxID=2780086 RepID=UPI0018F61212|nr:Smr/MutS family protein [Sandaracinobacteroides hominis]